MSPKTFSDLLGERTALLERSVLNFQDLTRGRKEMLACEKHIMELKQKQGELEAKRGGYLAEDRKLLVQLLRWFMDHLAAHPSAAPGLLKELKELDGMSVL
ncbi:hypothetical protein NHQ30_006875 [Ciborinia camelliae]|nr:hypothetical protein NHQ30_006875 [Ciborinia camelliae]